MPGAGVNLDCDWKAGFVMDPSRKQRVGYLTSFGGLDLGDLAKDIEVYTPYGLAETGYSELALTAEAEDKPVKTVACVGVLESYSFGGGVGDPICISAYISAQNAMQLAAKMKTSLTTTKVTGLGWWAANYDVEAKAWYAEAYPKAPTLVSAQLNAQGGKDVRLMVAAEPVKIAANIDVMVYNVYFEVVPDANATHALHFANSSTTNFIRAWGLKISAT